MEHRMLLQGETILALKEESTAMWSSRTETWRHHERIYIYICSMFYSHKLVRQRIRDALLQSQTQVTKPRFIRKAREKKAIQ